jgi:hypothetical protein
MKISQRNSSRAALVVAIFLAQIGCGAPVPDDEISESRGPRGLCGRLRAADAQIEEWTEGSRGYACRTRAEGETISITAVSAPSFANSLESVRLEGSYIRGRSEETLKRQMLGAAATLFARLQMAVPPGIAVALRTRSRSEVQAGGLCVLVEHHCPAANSECRIAIDVVNSGIPVRSQQARLML